MTSPTGIKAWLVEDHNLPLITISFAWRHGMETDPETKQGLSYLGAKMLTQGAGTDNANAFQKKLQDNSINLSFATQRDVISGNLSSLKETWGTAEIMLKTALMQPRFDGEDAKIQKAKIISTLRGYQSDQGWLLARMAFSQIFKDHPYGNRTLGSEETLQNISQKDLQAWHQNLNKDDLIVSAAGDITPDELKLVMDNLFSGLPNKTNLPAVAKTENKAAGIYLFKQKGTQSQFMQVWQGFGRHDPEWYAQEIFNYIWGGGGFSSRLTHEIREKRGLTYGLDTGMMDFTHASLYVLQGSSKNQDITKVLSLIDTERQKIINHSISKEELQAAQDYLIGSYPLQLSSRSKLSEYYAELQRQNLPMDQQERRAAKIRAVTMADVQRVAKRLLSSPPALFIVGDPEGIKADTVFDKMD